MTVVEEQEKQTTNICDRLFARSNAKVLIQMWHGQTPFHLFGYVNVSDHFVCLRIVQLLRQFSNPQVS
jgi:hypothetical protein